MGTIADLIHFRLVNERTVRKVREGDIDTVHGAFHLSVYRDQTAGEIHLALSKGDITPEEPTLVRVHVKSALRDLVGNELDGRPSWSLARCMKRVADAGKGVVVLLAREEGADQLLESVEMALGNEVAPGLVPPDTYNTVGLGSQILRDLGVGKIHLMGAPIKYNAISGFGLEVEEFVTP